MWQELMGRGGEGRIPIGEITFADILDHETLHYTANMMGRCFLPFLLFHSTPHPHPGVRQMQTVDLQMAEYNKIVHLA